MKNETKKALIIEMIHAIIETDSQMNSVSEQLQADKSLTSKALEKVRHLESESRQEVIGKIKKYQDKEVENDFDNLIADVINNTIEAVADIYLMIKQ